MPRDRTRQRAPRSLLAAIAALAAFVAGRGDARATYVNFESEQVRPLALSADGTRLYAVNTPDARLEILAVTQAGLAPLASVAVGLDPVALAVAPSGDVWVVNHLSDSVSVVDAAADPPRVKQTLLVGDEPRDVVFAGAGGGRAFVSTAHRGQNSPADPQSATPGVGRADVWVFEASAPGASLGGDPLAILTLFGDTPRSLAATPDGSRVFAAVFHSGNKSGPVAARAVCDGGESAPPCAIDGLAMPGGLLGPNVNAEGIAGPEVGLIARYDPATGAWLDRAGRDWRNAMLFTLPDLDVFAIDANATPPVQVESFAGVGTTLFGMAVDGATGDLLVANTEARNDLRFEGLGLFGGPTLRGHQHESRVTFVSGSTVAPRHLNPHIDYDVVPSAPRTAERSVALPAALAIDAAGTTLYVAAFGSSALAAIDLPALRAGTWVPDSRALIALAGGGPSGIALDEARGRAYVSTRFDDAVSVVDLAARAEVAHLRLHDAEPAHVRAGRPLFYDARLGSSNGEAACASCHVSADVDGVAWDLGNPDLPVVPNPIPIRVAEGSFDPAFHPLKGPMTTQTLRGIADSGAMHWRGDRNGASAPGGDPFDPRAALLAFEPAFVSLLGRASDVSDADMGALADFLLDITPPPNPHRPLDGHPTPEQQAAMEAFLGPSDCHACHELDTALKEFGTDGQIAVNSVGPQFMKVPQLRSVYQKVGFFGVFPSSAAGSHARVGDQVRGFGILHDGAGMGADLPAEVSPFLMAFPTNLAPIVGQQVTLGAAAPPAADDRATLLWERAGAGDCDLIAKGVVGGESRGWLRLPNGTFAPDRAGEPALDAAALRALAATPGQEITLTCAPPGSGRRLGIDRDEDCFLDRDEIDAGTDPADAASAPGTPCTPSPSPTPSRTPHPTATPRPTPSPAPSAPPTPTPSEAPTPTASPSATPAATATAPPTATPAPTATPDAGEILGIRATRLHLDDGWPRSASGFRRRARFASRPSAGAASGVEPPAAGSAGDPTERGAAGGGAVLEVYDAAGSGELARAALPAGLWAARGGGRAPSYRYRDPGRLHGPVDSISVARDGTLRLHAGGPRWTYTLNEPQQGAIALRLRLGAGPTWCALVHPAADPSSDAPGSFVGAPDQPPPAPCPPLP